jgi:hypothetical protein
VLLLGRVQDRMTSGLRTEERNTYLGHPSAVRSGEATSFPSPRTSPTSLGLCSCGLIGCCAGGPFHSRVCGPPLAWGAILAATVVWTHWKSISEGTPSCWVVEGRKLTTKNGPPIVPSWKVMDPKRRAVLPTSRFSCVSRSDMEWRSGHC